MSSTIEIRGPRGPQEVTIPPHWTIHDVTAVRQILEAAGYQSTPPRSEALFAYEPAPKPAVRPS